MSLSCHSVSRLPPRRMSFVLLYQETASSGDRSTLNKRAIYTNVSIEIATDKSRPRGPWPCRKNPKLLSRCSLWRWSSWILAKDRKREISRQRSFLPRTSPIPWRNFIYTVFTVFHPFCRFLFVLATLPRTLPFLSVRLPLRPGLSLSRQVVASTRVATNPLRLVQTTRPPSSLSPFRGLDLVLPLTATLARIHPCKYAFTYRKCATSHARSRCQSIRSVISCATKNPFSIRAEHSTLRNLSFRQRFTLALHLSLETPRNVSHRSPMIHFISSFPLCVRLLHVGLSRGLWTCVDMMEAVRLFGRTWKVCRFVYR